MSQASISASISELPPRMCDWPDQAINHMLKVHQRICAVGVYGDAEAMKLAEVEAAAWWANGNRIPAKELSTRQRLIFAVDRVSRLLTEKAKRILEGQENLETK